MARELPIVLVALNNNDVITGLKHKYHVDVASREDLLQRWSQGEYSAAIIGVGMRSLVESMRQAKPAAPIIVAGGDAMIGIAVRDMRLALVDHVCTLTHGPIIDKLESCLASLA